MSPLAALLFLKEGSTRRICVVKRSDSQTSMLVEIAKDHDLFIMARKVGEVGKHRQ